MRLTAASASAEIRRYAKTRFQAVPVVAASRANGTNGLTHVYSMVTTDHRTIYLFIISVVHKVHRQEKTEQSTHAQIANNVRHIASSKNLRQTSQAVTNHYTFLQ